MRQVLASRGRRGAFMLLAAACLLTSRVGAQLPTAYAPRAPELVGRQWLNTEEGRPIRLAERKGKVTIVHFMTYG